MSTIFQTAYLDAFRQGKCCSVIRFALVNKDLFNNQPAFGQNKGLATIKLQAIIRIFDGIIYWYMCSSHGLSELHQTTKPRKYWQQIDINDGGKQIHQNAS